MNDNDRAAWEAGLDVLRRLEEAGHPAYLVGGCVRDKLLGRGGGDVDIATAAEPETVMEIFPDVLPTGLKHGTVTVREAGFIFEVTTFRQEAGYSDSRHPDAVAFVRDVREDLARRDFTVNAMAFGSDAELVDPFGGRDDMKARLLRAVGDAAERFGEDALRMLRGIRFAAELGYRIEDATWRGLLAQRDKLRHVAMERVGVELNKMIAGSNPARALALLAESGLADRTAEPLPERLRDTLGTAAPLLDGMRLGLGAPAEALEPDLRWAALLLACGVTPAEARDAMRALRYASRRAGRIEAVVRLYEQLAESKRAGEEAKVAWIRTVLDRGREAARDALRIAAALPHPLPLTEDAETALRLASKWMREMPAGTVKELAVKGDELARAVEAAPGPWVARHLRLLLEEVALGRTNNDKEALLAAFEDCWRKEREATL
ncbi:CCA tRNA nucleotidyltransferase [Cohnella sp. REN36]|uniref:CCA tRNA nucleotidyltransferase n=1 Tax=Cohnella sp. REN36 TaxID=2887347 RepID=UPI001D1327A9|nr:CCA tRNA nucleotidyltransferase [Cohnella sp. REN36]MCC3376493.1 CCA tRNA nucleotidyltransferase [Cohnella sp. REN36]